MENKQAMFVIIPGFSVLLLTMFQLSTVTLKIGGIKEKVKHPPNNQVTVWTQQLDHISRGHQTNLKQ
jgi:uncharacterized membrane protein